MTRWWSQDERELPNWASACKKVLLNQLSSPSPERLLFHILENPVRKSQARAVEIEIQAWLALHALCEHNAD